MADEKQKTDEKGSTEGAESEPNPEMEARALKMGWTPKDRFRGDPENFVDAEEFVRRGEEFLPFLKSNNKALQKELNELKGTVASQANTLKANAEAMETLKKHNTEAAVRKVKEQRKETRLQIEAARKEDKPELVVELQEQLDEQEDALRKAAEDEPEPEPTGRKAAPRSNGKDDTDYTKSPEFQQFLEDNPWWNTDKRARAVSLTIGQELAAAGELADMTPTERFEKIAEETKKYLRMGEPSRRTSKVDNGSSEHDDGANAHGGGGRRNGQKGYAELPADAKAACENDAMRLVGEGRAYKTIKEWRVAYAEQYWNS